MLYKSYVTKNFLKKNKIPSYLNKNSYYTYNPSIFHKPKLKLYSVRNSIHIKNNYFYSKKKKYLTFFSWRKPVLFVKNCRDIFLYNFFLKKNIKSITPMFINLKKYTTYRIQSFFFKTIHYSVKTLFPGISNQTLNIVYMGGNKLNSCWYIVKVKKPLQVIFKSSTLSTKLIRKFNKSSRFVINQLIVEESRSLISGIVDLRSNLFIVTSLNTTKRESNILNLANTSTYNWKIII